MPENRSGYVAGRSGEALIRRPVAMYYDGGCPLCRREVAHYRRLDRAGRVAWVDISATPAALEADGIDLSRAMAVLHVRDANGELHRGARAFVTLWRELPGYRWLARIAALPGVLAVLDSAYARFARWRLARRACTANECQSR